MLFNKRIVDEDWILPEEVLTLSTNNHKVNSINALNLKNIDSREYSYQADIEGNIQAHLLMMNLSLK